MHFEIWLSFLFTTFLVSLSPGAAAVTAMSAGLNHGFSKGAPLAAGLACGVVTQYLIVSVGLGALIAASTWAFTLIQWVGSLYLIWIGVQQCRAAPTALGGPASGQPDPGVARSVAISANKAQAAQAASEFVAAPASELSPSAEHTPGVAGAGRQLWVQGWLVNTTNPKGTIFLLALVPQFVDATQPLPMQYLAIGATFAVCEGAVMLGYVAAAAQLQRYLSQPKVVKTLNLIFGSLLVVAGLALLWFKA